MKEEVLKELTDSITSKLGEENSSIIADDLGKLITSNAEAIDTINNLNSKISSLEDTNKKLVASNGALLQQVPMVKKMETETEKPTEEKNPKDFNFKSVFDKYGNFREDL